MDQDFAVLPSDFCSSCRIKCIVTKFYLFSNRTISGVPSYSRCPNKVGTSKVLQEVLADLKMVTMNNEHVR